MYDREYGLYDVFGKNPLIQPSMRRTSKLAYEKSKLSLLDVQCQQSISKKEIANFIQNNDHNDIAIFETYSIDTAYQEYNSLVARMSVSGGDYVITKGFRRDDDDDVTLFFTDISETEESRYHQLVESLSKDSTDESFVKTDAIFADPFTTYKILSKRHICLNLNKNYPKIQTLKQFDGIIDRYSHFSQAPFLNAYLVASATAMGFYNSGLREYELKINVDNYNDEGEAYIDYNNGLTVYAEETKPVRVNLVQKIRNKIVNLN
jgi:hypothetical protein